MATPRLERLGRFALRGLRIAYSPRMGYVPFVDPEIEAAVAAAAGAEVTTACAA